MYIGIDVGGSHIGFGLLDDNFNIILNNDTYISRKTPIEEIVEILKEGIQNIINENVKYIGIGFPGICNLDTKLVTRASNIDFNKICIPQILENEFNIPVYIDNDANVATIAEYFKGSLNSTENGILLTIGTGIGGGIILDGKIYRGTNYTAGEFGHMCFEKDGIKCGCGRSGCFEKYAALSVLKKTYTQNGFDFPNLNEILDMDDLAAKIIYEKWIDNLTDGIASIYNIYDPDKVIIGGGFAKYFENVQDKIIALVQEKVYNKEKEIIIEKAFFENDAGLIGAAMLGQILY